MLKKKKGGKIKKKANTKLEYLFKDKQNQMKPANSQ